MNSLHEITQRWLCRVLFLVAGLAPTLAVIAWAGVVHTSWHQATYEREASRLVSANTTFENLEFPRPGVTRISGFAVHDPHSEQLLLEATTLEVVESNKFVTIDCDQVRVHQASPHDVAMWLARALRTKVDTSADKLRITLEQVQLGSDQTYKVICDRIPTDNTTRFNVAIIPSGSEARVAMSVLHDRLDSGGVLRLVLDSNQAALPCSWIAKRLGDDATFQGKLWARLPADAQHWYVDALAGQFARVDLIQLTEPFTEKPIVGTATANIRGALLKDGRLVKVAGEIISSNGAVPADLVTRLATHLHMKSTIVRPPTTDRITYDQLAFAFALDAEGLMIEGRIDEAHNILASSHGTLASLPACDAVPLATVLTSLAHPDAPLVPWNSTAPWISSLVPAEPTKLR